jgi:long-chain acyl-CoA synthetase
MTNTTNQTIPESFLYLLTHAADSPALHTRSSDGAWSSVSYAEYAEHVARAAAGLQAAGVKPGDRILLLMRNRPEFHWFDLAVQFLRAIPVSIYNSSAAEEIAFLANDAGARLAIVEDQLFLDRVLAAREIINGHEPSGVLSHVYAIEPTPSSSTANGIHLAATLTTGDALDLAALASAVQPDDIATIIYTSGTTGNPKGVVITQGQVTTTVEQLRLAAEINAVPGRRTVSYLPMAHIAERMLSHYQAITLGYDVYCCPDAALLATVLGEARPQILFGVPRVWEKIKSGVLAAVALDPEKSTKLAEAVTLAKDIKTRERTNTSSNDDKETWAFLDAVAFTTVRQLVGLDALEHAVTGAAPIPVDVLEWFNAIGVPLSEIYGMSESSGPMTWSPLDNRPGYVGRPIPGGEIRLAADGEVLYRGPNVFAGYWQNPEKTNETLIDGWLHSGDIGEIGSGGFLRIIDRKKELIITSGGKNISPANLEAALKTIDVVGQAAAIGDGRKYCTALLVLDPDAAKAWASAHGKEALTLDALTRDLGLRAHLQGEVDRVNQRFAQVEQIKTFSVISDEWLPDTDVLTPTAKLKRRGIAARYSDVIESMYESD